MMIWRWEGLIALLASNSNEVTKQGEICRPDITSTFENENSVSPCALERLANVSKVISDMAKSTGVDLNDELLMHLEGVGALFITLQGVTDYVAMSSAIILYLRKFSDQSLTRTIMSYISELFEVGPQSGEEVVGSSDWTSILRNMRSNWKMVKHNKLFSHFSKLLGLLVTMEMCKASSVTFKIKEFRVWEPDLELIHGDAMDIFDAALDTVVFFVETLSMCWEMKSLKPLLTCDRAATQIDEEYANMITWWELVKNGNLERLTKVTENEFDNRLEALISQLRDLSTQLKGFDQKIVQEKYIKLLQIKNDYVTFKISSGVRRAPYCIELFGASSQGKTTYGEQVLQALLTSAGLPTDKRFQATYNASDKFMSTWTTSKVVMLIDDMCNDKSNFVERPPTRAIIDFCNNTPFYANMADIGSKGKVFVEPKICLVTTNVKDLDARLYSNCPYSIQRRMHVVITVEAKKEFQFIVDDKPQGIDSTKVEEFNAKKKGSCEFDDIWTLKLEKAVQPGSLKEVASYKTIEWDGRLMENLSFQDALQYLIVDFHKHLASQDAILARMSTRKQISVCGVDGCKQIKGWCNTHPVACQPCEEAEPHFGEEIVDSINNAGTVITDRIRKDIFGLDRAIEGATTFAIMASARYFARHWDWISAVPTPWLNNRNMRWAMMILNKDKLRNSYIRKTCLLWTGVIGSFWFTRKHDKEVRIALGTAAVAAGITTQKAMVSIVKRDFDRQLIDRNTVAPMIRQWRDRHVGTICKACSIVGVLYGLSKVYKAWRRVNPQGSLEPTTHAEIAKRDAQPNVWTSVVPRALPIVPETATTTSEQLFGLVDKNLVYGSIHLGERTLRADALFLTSNVLLLPQHYFEKPELDITFRKKHPDASGGKFAARVSLAQSVLLPNSDIRVCYVPTGGSYKDLRKYLIDEEITTVEFGLLWRGKDGEVERASGLGQIKPTTNGAAEFMGIVYKSLTINTFQGMCGAPLISKRRPILLGVHLGGAAGTPRGCAGLLQKSVVCEAIEDLRKIEGVIVSGSAEKFEPQVLGVRVLTGQKLHPKSPLNYMPDDSQVVYYGSCPGMSTFRSNVQVSKISEHVTDVLGAPNIYGPPVVEPQYFGWQTCLANLAVPAHPFSPELLQLAIQDYKEALLPIFASHLWNESRPLNDHENLCGIPGIKFIDSIPLNTSIGFPLSGPKRDFVVELEPTEEKPNNRILSNEIMEEIQRCYECYKRGERAYTIAKACKKDEVLSKKKCRIFYGNPIALTFLIRKFYLPILRILQFNPKVSECAVGINSHGPEWQELHEHIFHFGSDRLIGGDYGKYDQKLPSQLIFATLRIMIDFARECQYSEEDLRVMEAMAGDIVYALVAYNGDLIGLTEGTHISGNSLTVAINGVCGSLNLRCYFYQQNKPTTFGSRKRFRDYVKLATYGDDNIGSVSSEIDNFTIKGASKFLAEYGQTYTMPDKESELLDFLPEEEFEFLKRKSVWVPELGVHVGALIDKSCTKMLHCYLRDKKSPLTEEHACAQNIDTALREWFNHGRETYEKRREQMKIIASRAGITHLCTQLEEDFDAKVLYWKDRYQRGDYVSEPSSDESFYEPME